MQVSDEDIVRIAKDVMRAKERDNHQRDIPRRDYASSPDATNTVIIWASSQGNGISGQRNISGY